MVSIMRKSEKAKLTTSKLEGVLSDLVLLKMYITMEFPVMETKPSIPMTKPRMACHRGFNGGNWYQ